MSDKIDDCPKCEAHMVPILATAIIPPEYGAHIDEEDQDYEELDATVYPAEPISMGFLVCRECHATTDFWVADPAGVRFRPDWGAPRADQALCPYIHTKPNG